jgi:predicted permease
MRWLEALMNDVRHAWRSIVRMPVLATVVVLSLGAGIGVNTTVFSWIELVIFKPIAGVRDASSLYLVEARGESGSHPGMSWLEYKDLRAQLRLLPDVLAFRMVPLFVGEPKQTAQAYGMLVSDNYFSALGLRPALGRFFRSDELSQRGGEPVVVISYDYWQSHFAGAANTVGRPIRVNNRELTIVGVAPPKFQGTVLALSYDMWVPATMAPVLFPGSTELEDRGSRGYSLLGRVAGGATVAQARSELDAAMRRLAAAYPETNATTTAEVLSFWQAPRGPQRMLANALLWLQGVMVLLLLAVCGNTANLILARASARHREIGVRLALGASPWRIVSSMMSESLVLAVLGAGLGAGLAVWGTGALRAVPMISTFPIKFETSIDGAGLAFAMTLGIACGLIFGIAPALQLARIDPQVALRSGAQTSLRGRMRNTLMALEVALAVIVLIAAGLFFRSFRETRDIDPGFRREGVLLAAYDLTGRNADTSTARLFAANLVARLLALPSVDEAAIASSVPLDIHGLPIRSFTLEGRARNDASPDQALTNVVTPGYLRTLDIPLLAGTDFADLSDATAPPQAIVNEAFVKRYLGDQQQPLGRRLESRGRTYTIVGVARTSTYDAFGEPPTPIIYFSYRDRPSSAGQIHIRTRPGTEMLLASEVRRAVQELDPTLPIYDVRTLADHVERNLFLRRIPARMFVVLGPLLLLLAAIGIYAVVAFTVSNRTTEIGVRLALGATRQRVVSQIVAESLRVIANGMVIGLLLAVLVAAHAARGAMSMPVFLGVPTVLMIVATVACYIPALRAASIDPMVALKHE